MKINVIKNESIDEIEITIQCKKVDPYIENIVSNLKLLDLTITGKIEDRIALIETKDVYYFESVEEKIFCYTKDNVYETKYRLYELESLLSSTFFVRVSRTTILNIKKIKYFRSIISGRIECLLRNDEKVMISRNYVKDLKVKLGLLRGDVK